MITKNDLIIPYTWEERRPCHLDRFFYVPKAFDPVKDPLDFTKIFGNSNPCKMEICSGNGQWIAEKAQANPNTNWIAVEMWFERARKIWLKSFRYNLPNLYVVCAEASIFIDYYAPEKSVEEIFVNFPDPWPKRHHGKHRLIWAPFIQSVQKIVRDGVTLATDDEPYRDQMIREFEKAGGWEAHPVQSDSYGDSYFANLWKAKGRNLHYLRYKNVH